MKNEMKIKKYAMKRNKKSGNIMQNKITFKLKLIDSGIDFCLTHYQIFLIILLMKLIKI